jgi:TRL-like protein family
MKKLIAVLLLTTFAALGNQCAVGPVGGLLFASSKFPGDINPANDVPSAKTGQGCQHYILGLIAFGHAGAGQIAQDNGILRIATVDHSSMSILHVFYNQYCTIVSGQ